VFEDTKEIIKIRISKKNRQHNGQSIKGQKDKQRSTKHTHKAKELRCSGRVVSSTSMKYVVFVLIFSKMTEIWHTFTSWRTSQYKICLEALINLHKIKLTVFMIYSKVIDMFMTKVKSRNDVRKFNENLVETIVELWIHPWLPFGSNNTRWYMRYDNNLQQIQKYKSD
jgi:hypothetical protein